MTGRKIPVTIHRMKAPNFSLPDAEGTIHSLADYLGKWLVLYFYPKDDTPGCTKEACGFRDSRKAFKEKDVAIVGISKDSVASHSKFKKKFDLNFPLLSDESTETIKAYNAWGPKKFMVREFFGTLRKTYLIDPKGTIQKVYEKVDPVVHAQEVLSDIQALQAS